MFEVSRRADYAVRSMLALGELEEGTRMKVAEICAEMDVPQAYLYQISRDLIKAGLVRATAGPKGGLEIIGKVEEISILEIIEAVEGPICVNICLKRPKECPRDRNCPAHRFWGEFQSKLRDDLDHAKLATFIEESKALKAQDQFAISIEEIKLLDKAANHHIS